ncbi:MAG: M24 family metallopeptidase, partial [Bacteroidota bacterium]
METMKNKIERIQEALRTEDMDGWLLYNFRDSNIFAKNILSLPPHIMCTRRYYYFIPSQGKPRKLVHRIEEWNLDTLPGDKTVYLSWQSLHEGLKKILHGTKLVAIEYSPFCAIPYVATVDAGTIELVKSAGVQLVSSANLIQRFESIWDGEQRDGCFESAIHLRQIVDVAFGFIREKLQSASPVTEFDVQQCMLAEFEKRGLTSGDAPNCSVNANAANPHYEPAKDIFTKIKKGDIVLLDLWAKKKVPRSVYADITWMGYAGESVPDEYERIFQIVKGGRDAALNFIRSSFAAGKTIHGYEVDDAARNFITGEGFGEYFVHRTGHSIGEEVHGTGANMDNLETHDERILIPETCFSIEPGIYFRDRFGVRSEIDVYISKEKEVIVPGLPI